MQSLGLGEVSLTKNVIMSGDSAERTRILFTVLKATRVEYVTNMTIWDDFVGEWQIKETGGVVDKIEIDVRDVKFRK